MNLSFKGLNNWKYFQVIIGWETYNAYVCCFQSFIHNKPLFFPYYLLWNHEGNTPPEMCYWRRHRVAESVSLHLWTPAIIETLKNVLQQACCLLKNELVKLHQVKWTLAFVIFISWFSLEQVQLEKSVRTTRAMAQFTYLISVHPSKVHYVSGKHFKNAQTIV